VQAVRCVHSISRALGGLSPRGTQQQAQSGSYPGSRSAYGLILVDTAQEVSTAAVAGAPGLSEEQPPRFSRSSAVSPAAPAGGPT